MGKEKYTTRLKNLARRNNLKLEYENVLERRREKRVIMRAVINGQRFPHGEGTNTEKAMQNAARNALKSLNEKENQILEMKRKDNNAQRSHLKCRKPRVFDSISKHKTNGASRFEVFQDGASAMLPTPQSELDICGASSEPVAQACNSSNPKDMLCPEEKGSGSSPSDMSVDSVIFRNSCGASFEPVAQTCYTSKNSKDMLCPEEKGSGSSPSDMSVDSVTIRDSCGASFEPVAQTCYTSKNSKDMLTPEERGSGSSPSDMSVDSVTIRNSCGTSFKPVAQTCYTSKNSKDMLCPEEKGSGSSPSDMSVDSVTIRDSCGASFEPVAQTCYTSKNSKDMLTPEERGSGSSPSDMSVDSVTIRNSCGTSFKPVAQTCYTSKNSKDMLCPEEKGSGSSPSDMSVDSVTIRNSCGTSFKPVAQTCYTSKNSKDGSPEEKGSGSSPSNIISAHSEIFSHSQFDYIEKLGKGAFGRVLKVKDKLVERYYAIKIICWNKKALREAMALSDLDHPNIIRYFSCWMGDSGHQSDSTDNSSGTSQSSTGSPKKCLYIQMELCDTKTLRDWIDERNKKKSNSKRREESLNIVQQMVSGIKYVHSKKLIHRDLKPANILFGQDAKVKIGDFGLVTAENDDDDNSPMKRTEKIGTPSYMAPEQKSKTNGRTNYGRKVDIFALGLIYFELLWKFSTRYEKSQIWNNIRKQELPEEFESSFTSEYIIIISMLSMNPKDRPEASEIITDLEECAKWINAEEMARR